MDQKRRGFLKALAAAPVAAVAAKSEEKTLEKPRPIFQPHTVFRVRSSKTGKPELTLLKSWEDQVAFCRDEGLINPATQVNISEEGQMIVQPYPEHGTSAPEAQCSKAGISSLGAFSRGK